jgi:hypothetical protein
MRLSAEELIERSEALRERIDASDAPLQELAAMTLEERATAMRGLLLEMVSRGSSLRARLLIERDFFGVSDRTLDNVLSYEVASSALSSDDARIRNAAMEQLQLSPELREFAEQEIALAREGKSRRNAQNAASVFASASAAGADFGAITDSTTAIRTMVEGVYGSADEGFDTTLFRLPQLSEEEIASAIAHLDFVDGTLCYVDAK